jgi:hypothetical protein
MALDASKALALVLLVAALAVVGAEGSVRRDARSTPAGSTAMQRPATVCRWSLVATPTVGAGELLGVAASSPSDAWAVGDAKKTPLTEHWDGSKWTVIPSPWIEEGVLNDVAAISARDAWAVGGGASMLVEHWDGRRWTRVAIPSIAMQPAQLWGVAALSPSDVWAVGWGYTEAGVSSVSLHWDGTAWTRVPMPPPRSLLADVVAVSAHDVWAVGKSYGHLFTMRWDGRRWRPFVGPELLDDSTLDSAAAVAANDVWAVGEADSGNTIQAPVVYHWDGTQWRTTHTPHIGGGFTGIAARSTNNVWISGWDDPQFAGARGATIWRWNGKTWNNGSNAAFGHFYFAALASDRGAHLWAVGSTAQMGRPLIERGC